jgi:hypothetical protein
MHKSSTGERPPRNGSGVGHQFSLSPPPDGDHGALIKAAASWHNGCDRTLQSFDKRVGRIQESRQRFCAEMSNLVGEEAVRKFAAFSREHRAAADAMLRSGHGADRKAASRRAREQSIRLMESTGVPFEKLQTLQSAYADEFNKIVRPRARASTGLSLVPPDRTPQSIRDLTTFPNRRPSVTDDGLTIFTPPFDGWWWKGNWWHSGGETPEIDIYPDPASGAIGHRSDWQDHDASDVDALSVEYHTSISAWYLPPKTGLLDVWILATCASAQYNIYLSDEWGWSDSHSWMTSQITANVSPVIDDEDVTENWAFDIGGNPDGETYADDAFPGGDVRFFNLRTTQPVLANVWSMLRVGTRDDRWTVLNDVSTNQLMRNRWFVNAIFVRMV